LEQDEKNPHCYTSDDFTVREGDTLLDVGCSEANFALSHIEKLKKLYLFECEPAWVDALNHTFAPWKDKVEIVNKYIGASSGGIYTTIDEFCTDPNASYFIKADIEGAETEMLSGASNFLTGKNPMRIVLCTYHRQNDARDIEAILKSSGFTTHFSQGYMIFLYGNDLEPPYLRHGVIRAEKNIQR
jgi:hypothetical protein